MTRRGRISARIVAAILLGLGSGGTAGAEPVAVRAWSQDGFGRIVFDWPDAVGFDAAVEDGRLRVRFDRPAEVAFGPVVGAIPGYVSGGSVEGDGRTVVFLLTRPVTLRSFRYGPAIAFDLVSTTATGIDAVPMAPAERPPRPPVAAPAPVAAPVQAAPVPAIRVRGGTHPDRGRLVFDWTRPVDYTVEQAPGSVRIVFSQPGTADLANVRRRLPRNVTVVEQDGTGSRLAVTVGIPQGSTIRHFRSGSSVALDVMDPPRAGGGSGNAVSPPAAKPASVVPAGAASAAASAAASEVASEAPPPRAAPATPVATTGPLPPPVAETTPASPTISVDPGQPAAAAVYLRGGFLHLVFDRPFPAGIVPAVQAAGRRIGEPEILPIPGIAGFRIAVPDGMEPDVRIEGTAWRVVLHPPKGAAPASLPVLVQPDFLLGPRVLVRAPSAATVVEVADPSAGDRLFVVPLSDSGAVAVPHAFLQARLLPAAQGIVVRPTADGLAVRPVRDGVEVTAEGGLLLSSREDRLLAQASAPDVAAGKGPAPLFEFASWRRGPIAEFSRTRQALQQAIVDAQEPERDRSRLDLARFYLGHGFGTEAAGLLSYIAGREPALEDQPEFRALRGAARVLAGDCPGATEDLAPAALDAHPEVLLWRAAAAACGGKWDEAAAGFGRVGDVLDRYPDPFFDRLSRLAVEAAVETGDHEEALRLIDRIVARVPGAEEAPAILYQRGHAERLAGRPDRAVELWRLAAQGTDQLYRTRAEFALIGQELADGAIAPGQAIERLERLRFAWRGDDFELSVLRLLGDLYLKTGKHALGFDTLRTASMLFSGHAQADAIDGQLRQGFSDLFAEGAAALPPLDALALHEQYRDLHPSGSEGDRIMRRLAERLVEIDLLDQAAEMLGPLVETRLHGADKAETGARLASIRLLDGEAGLAIAALDASEADGTPGELISERKVLRARALAETGRPADALALLEEETGQPADLLRVDIAWRAGNWAAAAAALDRIVGPPPSPEEAALSPREIQMVLNRAVALGLADDVEALERLGAEFGPAMAGTTDADAFRVLTRSGQGGGLVDLATIQRRVAEVDVFRSFLAEYRSGRAPAPSAPAGG